MLHTVSLPQGGGSALALTLAAVRAVTDDDPVLIASPCPTGMYPVAVERGAGMAQRGAIAVFALKPTLPDPGRAYLRAPGGYVEEFVAEPDAARARACFESGYLWSAGIFAVRASVWIEAVGCLRPDLLRACARGEIASCATESIERLVMERLAEAGLEAAVVLLDDALREAA